MSINLKKIIRPCFALWVIFIVTGCRSIPNNQSNIIKGEPQPVSSPPIKNTATATVLDVPQLAYKSAAEIELILGKPVEIKAVKADGKEIRGEYRLYNTPNHPQGLSVHFYNGQALIFNLVLGKGAESPRAALLNYLAIDVKDAAPIEKTQFLEKWRGKFNDVNFTSVYAMKERIERDDFKLLHAEVARLISK